MPTTPSESLKDRLDDQLCDLHTHSTASDGTDSPAMLAHLVADAGLAGFALTDHDTTDGIAEAAEAAEELGLFFLPGIELSASLSSVLPNDLVDDTGLPSGGGRGNLHVLGYGIDPGATAIQRLQDDQRQARAERNPQVIDKLNELGVRIDYEEVLALASEQGAATVGRPHIAQVLLNKGYVKSIHDAFQRYIGIEGEAHVRRDGLTAQDAIEAINASGGAAVIAHPVQMRQTPEVVEHVLTRLKDQGLSGVETRHPDHLPRDVAMLTQITERLDLVTTGGSDYHGDRKTNRLGQPAVGLEAVYYDWAPASTRPC